MNEDAFISRQIDILTKVPPHFRQNLATWAWNRAHASGYNAIIELLADLVDELILPSLADAESPTVTTSHCTECDGTGEIAHSVRRGYDWIEPSGIDQCPECGSGEEMPI